METDTVVPIFTQQNGIVDKHGSKSMGQGVDLYYFPGSAPCRSVLLLARYLGINLNLKLVDIMQGEQMKEEYLKLNPQHSVPTLCDNGLVLFESRAILRYLINQHAKTEELRPNSPREEAMVDQLLYFDATTLTPRAVQYYFPVIIGVEKPNEAKAEKVEEALELFNMFLEGNEFVANNKLSIADFALIATVSSIEGVQFNVTKYPNINKWYAALQHQLEGFGYEEINQNGVDMLAGAFGAKA